MSDRLLIDAETLSHMLSNSEGVCVLDCRARLEDHHAGQRLWREGHIPGSLHIDLDRDMAAPPGEGGRHPLPTKVDFTATLQQLGICPPVPVVVYDDRSGQLAAARAWWMLYCWAGHPDVRVLNGGIVAWRQAGGEITTEPSSKASSEWRPDFDDQSLVDAEEVAGSASLKLDARAAERFRGKIEPVDPVAGHIPGATCRPSAFNLAEDGCFKLAAELDIELPHDDRAISYCGSGVTACHNILAYAIAGRPLPRLYSGSWSHWIRDTRRPIAIGD